MNAKLLSYDNAKAIGFAKYNNCPHLCVEIPDGMFTISARTSEGKKITFSFLPYRDEEAPQCVDVEHHTAETVTMNHGTPLQNQNLIVFGYRKPDIRITPDQGYSKVCILLHEPK